MENYQTESQKWLESKAVSDEMKAEIRGYGKDELADAFDGYLEFGTAGLRAKMGAGTNRMNTLTVAHATMGLAELIKSMGNKAIKKGVVIAYDSRNNSKEFAERAAEVLSAEGIKAYLFDSLRPTPVLSYAVRKLKCIAGINITASHNPKEYNGYKAYFEDGAQLSPENAKIVSDAIANVDILNGVPAPAEKNVELIVPVSKTVDRHYIEEVLAQRVNPEAIPAAADTLKVVYTPLHGAGTVFVPKVLKKAGLTNLYTVSSQKKPDGEFPTVHFPNPEFPEAFKKGITTAKRVQSDLIIATDPDADRVGVMAKNSKGKFVCITGNQMGALLLDYIITAYKEQGKSLADAYAVKTIVTSEMSAEICRANGVDMYNVLTGFKFIGEVMNNTKGTFLLGFEESYGYLKGMFARDKDAVVASLLITEMAAYYSTKGMTLIDALEGLFEKYGYFKESVTNIYMDFPGGKEAMAKTVDDLRAAPLSSIGSRKVVEYRDYKTGIIKNCLTGEDTSTNLPTSNVLYYVTKKGDVVVIRPSGTEPKIKIYVLSKGETEKEANSNAKYCLNAFSKILNSEE